MVVKSLFRRLAVFVAVIMASLWCGSEVFAEEAIPEYRIQISPASIEVDLTPGKKTPIEFRVQNTGTKDFDFSLLTSPYSVVGEDYRQDISTPNSYTYIKDWITFSAESGEVKAGGEEKITATIDVPEDAPAGGQYAAIFARMLEPEGGSGGIRSEQQVGLLVYSKNIDGNTRETGNVVENKVPSFMFAPPISATSVVENTGNVHMTASYTLQVFPLFGDEEVYTNEDNPETHIIMPETRRLNMITWDGSPQLGIFKVRQTVKFAGDESITEKVVFICPIWFLFIILALIFLIVFWIVSRARSRKE